MRWMPRGSAAAIDFQRMPPLTLWHAAAAQGAMWRSRICVLRYRRISTPAQRLNDKTLRPSRPEEAPSFLQGASPIRDSVRNRFAKLSHQLPKSLVFHLPGRNSLIRKSCCFAVVNAE